MEVQGKDEFRGVSSRQKSEMTLLEARLLAIIIYN